MAIGLPFTVSDEFRSFSEAKQRLSELETAEKQAHMKYVNRSVTRVNVVRLIPMCECVCFICLFVQIETCGAAVGEEAARPGEDAGRAFARREPVRAAAKGHRQTDGMMSGGKG